MQDLAWQENALALLNALLWNDRRGYKGIEFFIQSGIELYFFATNFLPLYLALLKEFIHIEANYRKIIDLWFDEKEEHNQHVVIIGSKMLWRYLLEHGKNWNLSELQTAIVQLIIGNIFLEEEKDTEAALAFQEADKLLLSKTRPVIFDTHLAIGMVKAVWRLSVRNDLTISSELGTEIAKRSTQLSPSSADAWYAYSIALTGVQRHNEAQTAIKEAIRLNNKRGDLLSFSGHIYQNLGEKDEAEKAIEEAYRLTPNDVLTLNNLAVLYSEKGQIQEASKLFEKALDLYPKNTLILFKYALHLSKTGHTSQAVKLFNRIIEINSGYNRAYGLLGIIHKSEGKYSKALSYFNRTLALFDKDATIFKERGEIYRITGNFAAARADMESVEALDNSFLTNPEFLNEKGLLFSYLGSYDEALEQYQLVLFQEPGFYKTLYNIAVVKSIVEGASEAKKEIAQARAALQPLLGKENRADALYGLGGLEALEGNDPKALDYLKLAITEMEIISTWAIHDLAWQRLRNTDRFKHLINNKYVELKSKRKRNQRKK